MENHGVGGNKKKATWLGAYLIFCDESGFMLTPTVRRTWAPVGRTPLIHHHFANDRISVIAGISVSPTAKRLGLFGMFFWENIAQEHVVVFLHEVLRHLRGQLIVLLDNSNIHKGAPIDDLCRRFPRLCLKYFPPYAPELNPEEGAWGLLKGAMGNGRPDDIQDLAEQLQQEFRGLARSQPKLRGCIQQSGLPFYLS